MASTDVHAILLAARGGRLTSPGLWTMQAKLASMGCIAELHGSASWLELVPYVANYAHTGRRIALIGYSLGGMRAADMCNQLAHDYPGVKVALLFTIVPPVRQLSYNVLRVVNHTVPGGHAHNWWSDKIAMADPKLEHRVVNYEYTAAAGLSHYTIQFHPKVHASLAAEVSKL